MATPAYVNVAIPGGNSGVAGPFTGAGEFQLVTAGIHTYPTGSQAQAAGPQTLTSAQAQVFAQVVLEGPGLTQGFFGLTQNVQQVGSDIANAPASIAQAIVAGFRSLLPQGSALRPFMVRVVKVLLGFGLVVAGVLQLAEKPVAGVARKVVPL